MLPYTVCLSVDSRSWHCSGHCTNTDVLPCIRISANRMSCTTANDTFEDDSHKILRNSGNQNVSATVVYRLLAAARRIGRIFRLSRGRGARLTAGTTRKPVVRARERAREEEKKKNTKTARPGLISRRASSRDRAQSGGLTIITLYGANSVIR